MRVLFVFDNLDLSGAEKVALNLMRNCSDDSGIQASAVICMDDRLDGCWGDLPIHHLGAGQQPGGSLIARIRRGLQLVPELAALCRDADILIPVTPPAALWAAPAAWLAGKPCVPWVHYDLTGLAREQPAAGRWIRDLLQLLLYRHFVPGFRRLLFVSEAARTSFSRRSTRKRPGWRVVPNVYDNAGFANQPSDTVNRIQQIRSGGLPTILFLGRIFRQKRWEDAISAAEILFARGHPVKLIIIGDGLETAQLRDRITASPAQAHLHWLGADKNPLPALQWVDAMILTSRFEAWPTVILEAFAAQLTVFSYDCPSGPAQMIGPHNQRGILTEESPLSMANALEHWFWNLNAEQRHEQQCMMRAAGRDFLSAHRPDNALRVWREQLASLIGA